jgi:hypothetical protein
MVVTTATTMDRAMNMITDMAMVMVMNMETNTAMSGPYFGLIHHHYSLTHVQHELVYFSLRPKLMTHNITVMLHALIKQFRRTQ